MRDEHDTPENGEVPVFAEEAAAPETPESSEPLEKTALTEDGAIPASALEAMHHEAPPPEKSGPIQLLFELFCASVFLGMIGLVFYNAVLRKFFRSSFAPSEDWARFLFIYITFFGAIEAFIHHKHIAVDLLVGATSGKVKKTLNILASLCALFALGLLLYGGIINVWQFRDYKAVTTGVNMALIYGTLPIMAVAAIVVELKSLWAVIRRPASEFKKG